jgi:hypothetical protein
MVEVGGKHTMEWVAVVAAVDGMAAVAAVAAMLGAEGTLRWEAEAGVDEREEERMEGPVAGVQIFTLVKAAPVVEVDPDATFVREVRTLQRLISNCAQLCR